MRDFFATLSEKVSLFAKWFAGAGLLLMTGIIAWQVFARYVLNASSSWAEQAALLLMIWYVMFAAAAGVREGFHIRIGIFVQKLPDRAQHVVRFIAHATTGLFGVAMAFWGIDLVRETWQHVIPTLGISRGFAYVPMPIAGVLIAAFALEHLVADLRGTEVKKLWS